MPFYRFSRNVTRHCDGMICMAATEEEAKEVFYRNMNRPDLSLSLSGRMRVRKITKNHFFLLCLKGDCLVS